MFGRSLRPAHDSALAEGIKTRYFEAGKGEPLVFIHGIKGSVLSRPQGGVRWLTGWQAFGLASPDLSLPLQWHGVVQQSDGLVAQVPLRTVAWQDIYAPFLNWAATSNRPFRAFAYDWRRDNLENTEKSIQFLETVSQENGGVRIQVAAHSMGGLITFVALNRRPDLFHSVLFAGVPFRSTLSFLEDMHAGTATGFNRRILRPQVLFTFASPYSFFPTEPDAAGLVELNGDRIVHDWYSADDWARQKLGIFATSESDHVGAEQLEHLRRALDRAREFRDLLVFEKEGPIRYPPIAVLASDRHPTLSTAVRGGPVAVRGWDFHTATREPGDGRVEFAKAMPPEGVPYAVHKTAREHGELLNDPRQVAAILEQLCK